jgi:NAD(P)-dependent dehydrogenase (short-subunit alcohol dehydrogenase family)
MTTFQHALIVGASGGIGAALLDVGRARGLADRWTAWTRGGEPIVSADATAAVDLADETTIAAAAAQLRQVDLVLIATGVLHRQQPGARVIAPEKTWRALDAAVLADVFLVNTIGPALVLKHTLPLLPRDRRAVFAALSARVGSISDNRRGGWYGYRASKAALNQILRTAAIELATKSPQAVCIGLHPGTVATALSKPFRANVSTDKLFTPEQSAGYLLDVVAKVTPADSGSVFDWAGERVPA